MRVLPSYIKEPITSNLVLRTKMFFPHRTGPEVFFKLMMNSKAAHALKKRFITASSERKTRTASSALRSSGTRVWKDFDFALKSE